MPVQEHLTTDQEVQSVSRGSCTGIIVQYTYYSYRLLNGPCSLAAPGVPGILQMPYL